MLLCQFTQCPRREQARRKLTGSILKLQGIYLKLCSTMSNSGDDFNVEAFTSLLHDLANLSKATQTILSEVGFLTLTD